MSLPNVEILWDTVAKKIEGSDKVQALVLENVKTGENKVLAVDGVFVAVGIIPSGDVLKGLVKQDENGYVLAGEDCMTSMSGVFAAGDIRKKKLRR